MTFDPAALSAGDAAREIREWRLSSEDLVQACLARVRAHEPQIQAWQFLDAVHLGQAGLDQFLRREPALGDRARRLARRQRRRIERHRSRSSATVQIVG